MRQSLIVFSFVLLASCSPKSADIGHFINSSIINGSDVKETDTIAKNIVGVYDTKEKYLCTGTLIAPNIVLTAAHCVPSRMGQVKIIFATDIDYILNARELDVQQEFALQVTDAKVSTTWDPKSEAEHDTGDIALMKFKGNAPAGFKPAIFLPANTEFKRGDMITVAGYGVNDVDTSKQIDPKKYKGLEDAIDAGEVICDGTTGKYTNCFKVEMSGDGTLRVTEAPISFVLDTEIRLDERKAGTCSGDSGGPAFMKKNDQYFLLGVTSRGSALCNEVGVYTNALYYKTWIDQTIPTLK